jgi:tetratricopeptide (TPR) repeat protein
MNAVTRVILSDAPAPKQRGIASFKRSAWEEALADFDRALEESPRDAELHNYRARTFEALGRLEEALSAIADALAIDPANVADLKNQATLLRRLAQPGGALKSLAAILEKHPEDIDARVRQVHVLTDLERREEALVHAERALALKPDDLMALNARGMVLERLGRYDEALDDFDRMLSICPDHLDAINNRGMIQARRGEWADAFASYSHSLRIDPHQRQAIYNCSFVRLSLGDWKQGLREFESRWNTAPLDRARPHLISPQWSGSEDLTDRTIFVYHEQGYGDTLQCVRYLPLLIGRGARVLVAVPPALQRLIDTVEGKPEVLRPGQPVPPHDFHIPMMSLMGAFGTTPDSIPWAAPYLHVELRAVQEWQQAVGPSRRVRVGIAWCGRSYPPVNYPRDVPLSELKPLLALDADFVSLQTELSASDRVAAAQIPALDCESVRSVKDFYDTAALVSALDLVICVDSAIAHLAGALGKPVWLLNRHASCWRWGQYGSRSPWYPQMHIFRQRSVGEWGHVIAETCSALAAFIQEQGKLAPGEGAPRHRDAAIVTRSWAGVAARPPREAIRFVCATRKAASDFLATSPLGRSLPLYRTFPKGQRIEMRLFSENKAGLSSVYNTAIEESRDDPAILVFVHDDVHLSDYYWADHLLEGLREFDIVGLAGNRRRAPQQASWMYLNDQFQRDADENLSGVLGHGEGFPNLKQLSVYGEPRQECKLLDGVFLAVRSTTLFNRNLRFDPRFEFHFYDLDFCRQAEIRNLRMGTWPISVIHASAGNLGCDEWWEAYRAYLSKYGEQAIDSLAASSIHSHTEALVPT